jgi:arylamine N-acetyltransferase
VSSKAVTLFAERYGLPGRRAREQDLATLASRFAELPYENLSKIIALAEGGVGSPRLRRPEQVMEDHLALGTGGTCFSLVELLRGLATAAGFPCHPAMAHMRHGPNIHCVLLCEAEGRSFVVDPGYLLPRPLPLEPGPVSLDGARLGSAHVVPAGSLGPVPAGIPEGELDLYTIEPEGPLWRYRLDPRPPTFEEFESHWRASFAMPAMRSLLCTRRDLGDEIVYLHNHKLRRRSAAGKRTENVRADLCERVEELFGIAPEVTRRAAELVQIARKEATGR